MNGQLIENFIIIKNTMIYFIGNTAIHESPHYQLATIDDVVDYCSNKTVLGVDTETEGFDFTCKKMIMFQIGDADNQYIIDTRFISIESLRNILENKDIIKIFHNSKFDYKFIKKWSGITCQGVYDTFLVELVNSCGKRLGYSLKDLCKRYFNVELNKDVRNKFVGLNGKPFDNNQIVYGAKDVEYLCKIRELQLPVTEKYRLQHVVDLENEVVLAFADIEYNGLDLDKELWNSIESESMKNAEMLMINLDQMVIETPLLNKFICEYIYE